MMPRLLPLLALVSAAVAFAPSKLQTPTRTASMAPVLRAPSTIAATGMLQETELPQDLYKPQQKELPKVLGGLKIGLRKLVVITGASSGLGLNCAASLAKKGDYFVVMACRDVEKGKRGEFLPFPTLLLNPFLFPLVDNIPSRRSHHSQLPRKWACRRTHTSS